MVIRRAFFYFAVCTALIATDKRSPEGQVEDDAVSITATLLSADQLRQAVGTDFDNNYIVVDVHIAPKGGMPYAVSLDDFILRSESSGDHSGPFLSAGQIAGAGALVVERSYGNRSNPDSPRPLEGTKLEMKADEKGNPALDALKKKMLASKTISEPVSGLVFFPLNPKEKAKNLILSCKTPKSHLRLAFK
ncbi:MAG TPA: hypothetical protein VHZ74_03300 [Bryobacteraceae bacterium]|nr:hypothetical protein [Bryobacteraceae bacterium]